MSTTSPTQQSGVEEEWFDLLPVEKKLITYSLALGVALLIVFIFAFGVFK
jgi:hypothetical protein